MAEWQPIETAPHGNDLQPCWIIGFTTWLTKCWPIGLSPRQNQRRNAREQASGYRKSGCNNS